MTSREQFEAWFMEKYETTASSMKIMPTKVGIAWEAWQASRNVEIDLPDKVFVEDDFDTGHNCGIDYCAEAIRAVGFKVKGG